VFWIASLHDKPDFERQPTARRRPAEGSPELPVATPGAQAPL